MIFILGGIVMFYVSGDIHGDVNKALAYCKKHSLNSDDTIILLGDVGINYFGNDNGDKDRKEALNMCGAKILCIHGNHEMRPESISTYNRKQQYGGIVMLEEEYPNITFAIDGEIYDIAGNKAIVIGGAYSVDKYYRLQRGLNWFSDEQPSAEIKQKVENTLKNCDWNIDIVFSHTCPAKYIPTECFFPMIDQRTVDNSTEKWLDNIEDKLTYKRWYCGHWHIDKSIDKMRFMMNDLEIIKGAN